VRSHLKDSFQADAAAVVGLPLPSHFSTLETTPYTPRARCPARGSRPTVRRFTPFAYLARISRIDKAHERTRTADLLQLRVCLRTFYPVLLRPGIPLVSAVFDDPGVPLCPFCTSVYQPGCSTDSRITRGAVRDGDELSGTDCVHPQQLPLLALQRNCISSSTWR